MTLKKREKVLAVVAAGVPCHGPDRAVVAAEGMKPLPRVSVPDDNSP